MAVVFALTATLSQAAGLASGAECEAATVTAPIVADTWLDENSPSAAKGSDSILNIDGGSVNVDTGVASGRARALLRFSLPTGVPLGCVVESAKLRVYSAEESDSARVEVLTLASAWSENSASWSNQPATTGTAARAWSRQGYIQWNVTSHVELMLQGGTNHGFLMRDFAEGTETAAGHGFYAREKGENPASVVIRFAPPPSGEPPGPPAAPTPAAVSCGQVITESTLVTNDLSGCLGHGLVIGADRLIVDLGGHTIDGIGLGAGILNEGYDLVTVRNGLVQDFDYGVQLFPETVHNRIEGLTLRLHQVAAIELFEVADSEIIGNTLDQNGGGIELVSGTTGALVAGNAVTANGKDAIHIRDSARNRVEDNTVSGGGDLGIGLVRATDNTLLRNAVSANSDGGIEIRDGSHGNRIELNTVTESGDHGILVDLSDRNELIGNTSHRMSDSGITLNDGNDGVVQGNDVRFNTGGLQLDGSSRNLLEANNASSTSGIGIELGGGSLENQVVGNIADANGAQGIYVSDDATDPSGVPIPGLGNVLEANSASGNLSDGIVTGKGGHTLTANATRNNESWGISAAPATIDGGLNVATGNRKPEQCIGVVCREEWNPPETTITLAPAAETRSSSATFTFSGSDDTSPASALVFECSLDAAAFTSCTSPRSYAALATGAHTFRVRATDRAGNADPAPATYAWSIDLVAPDTEITAAPADPSNNALAAFAFAGTDNVTAPSALAFECRLGTADTVWTACSSPQSYSDLADATHSFEVRAVDRAGNVDASPAAYAWTVDTTPPEATINSGPEATTKLTDARFTFGADEPGTLACALDDSPPSPCTSPVDHADLTEGSHTFEVHASDEAGNSSEAASYVWTIDLTPPVVTLGERAADPTNSAAASFTFTADEPASFECTLDADAPAECDGAVQYADLTEGDHSFVVQASDEAGNAASPVTYEWTVDTTPPGVTIDNGPADPTNARDAAFSFSGTDNHSSGEALSFACRLDATDAAAFGACPAEYADLTEGSHTFVVQASDEAGNSSEAASYVWTIDLTPPVVTLGERPADPTNSAAASFTFGANEPASFECTLDAGAPAACDDGSANYADLAEGSHSFVVQATDRAGTAGESVSHRWTIDLTRPSTTISGPDDPTTATSAEFIFAADEPATLACALDAQPLTTCISPVEYHGLGVGRHTFRVQATDRARNAEEPPAAYSWTIQAPSSTDTTPPDTTIEERPSDPSNDAAPAFTFGGTDDTSPPSALSFHCRLDSTAEAGWVPCQSPREYIGLASGVHTFAVRATDEAGNSDASPDSYTWTIDTTAPQTTINTGPSATTQSTSASFTFAGSDDMSAQAALTFRCALDDAAMAACGSPAAYSGLAEGPHTFRVAATDRAGNTDPDAATWSWTVDTTAPETTLGERPANPTNQTSASFTFSGTDSLSQPEALRFECRLDAAAFAACTAPRAYSALSAGSHTFQVRAIDAAGHTDASPASYTWTIDTAAPQTTLNSGPSGTVTSRDATFTFSSEAGATFQCSLDSTTAYAACTSPRTYSGLAIGSHTFRVRATDAAGNTDASPASRTWTIQGDTTAPNTTITGGPSQDSTTTSTSATFSFSSSEASSTFECALDGAAFAACTTPHEYTALSSGTHSFQVRARDAAGNTDQTPASRSWTVEIVSGCGGPVTLSATADAWIEQNSSSSNKGADSILKVKSQGPTDNFRALVQFDLPAAPDGCVLETATLRMYAASATSGRTIEAWQLAGSWSENAITWNNQPGTTGTAAVAMSGAGYRDWSVTAQVLAMYDDANHGFLIRDQAESGSGFEQSFHAREKGETPPQLVLRFAPEDG